VAFSSRNTMYHGYTQATESLTAAYFLAGNPAVYGYKLIIFSIPTYIHTALTACM